MSVVFDGDACLSYAQMYVEDPDDFDPFDMRDSFAGQFNGLCGAGILGRFWLFTGLHTTGR